MSKFNKDLIVEGLLAQKKSRIWNYFSSELRKFLIPFGTSDLCETEFSAMLATKSKYHLNLNLSQT